MTCAYIASPTALPPRTTAWTHHQWRISTVTSTLIERTGEPAYRAYRVQVECDYMLEAHCPTIERAAEIAHVYQALILPLWKKYGWPSWKSRTELE